MQYTEFPAKKSYNLNGVFFKDLKLDDPEAVLVLGDTNSCLCVIGAKRLHIPNMPDGPFAKKLYSLYLTYLPTDKFEYAMKMNVDDRGSFTELLHTEDFGQVSVNISRPGIAKGQHGIIQNGSTTGSYRTMDYLFQSADPRISRCISWLQLSLRCWQERDYAFLQAAENNKNTIHVRGIAHSIYFSGLCFDSVFQSAKGVLYL